MPVACCLALEDALGVSCCTLKHSSFASDFVCLVRWSPLHLVLQDMRSAKAAVAADFHQAKVKLGNLEAAVTTLKKEKEDQAAKHKASRFTCVCRAKHG